MTRKDRKVLGGEMNEYSPGDGLAARRLDLVITRTDTRAWLAWKRLVRRLVRDGVTCALEAGSGPLHWSLWRYFVTVSCGASVSLRHPTSLHLRPPSEWSAVFSFAVSVCLFVRPFCCVHLMRLLLFTGVFHFGSTYLVHVPSHQSHP